MNSTAVAQSMNHGMSTVMTHKAFGKHTEESLKAVCDEVIIIDMELQVHVTAGLKESFQAGEGINIEILN